MQLALPCAINSPRKARQWKRWTISYHNCIPPQYFSLQHRLRLGEIQPQQTPWNTAKQFIRQKISLCQESSGKHSAPLSPPLLPGQMIQRCPNVSLTPFFLGTDAGGTYMRPARVLPWGGKPQNHCSSWGGLGQLSQRHAHPATPPAATASQEGGRGLRPHTEENFNF